MFGRASLAEMRREWESQVQKVVDAGLRPSHRDGHCHAALRCVLPRSLLGVGGNDMVHHGEGLGREAHGKLELAQHREGLGARDLVDQVQAEEDLRLAAG
ncbi:MAG: ChbG/HpnK family deacetylase, partial [Deltaproteobacteria bacterium]|nr:ChbG/HpnK family deacetylase [Deltaproteobacteria bacterium]